MIDTIGYATEDKIELIDTSGESSEYRGGFFLAIGFFLLVIAWSNVLSEEGKFGSFFLSVIFLYLGVYFHISPPYHTITVDREFEKIILQSDSKSFKYIPFSDIKEIRINSEEGYWGINLITNQGKTENIFCKSSEPDVRNVAAIIRDIIGKNIL